MSSSCIPPRSTKTIPRQASPAAAGGVPGAAKALEISRRFPDDVTLAADTVVALGDTPLGKPADAAEARR